MKSNKANKSKQSQSKTITTNEYAKSMNVTPDTVRKWIQSGKIEAITTMGGHYRIPVSEDNDLKNSDNNKLKSKALKPIDEHTEKKLMPMYCWQFMSDDLGRADDKCLNCIVYKTKTLRCYELRTVEKNIGHKEIFCTTTCSECNFYNYIKKDDIQLLFISNNDDEIEKISRKFENTHISISVARNKSELIEVMNDQSPSYLIMDYGRLCEMQLKKNSELNFWSS